MDRKPRSGNNHEALQPSHTSRFNLDSWDGNRDSIPWVKEDFRVRDFMRHFHDIDLRPLSRPQRVNMEIAHFNHRLGEIAKNQSVLQDLVPSDIAEQFKDQVKSTYNNFARYSQAAIKNYGDLNSSRSRNQREQAFTELKKLNDLVKKMHEDLVQARESLSSIYEIQANQDYLLAKDKKEAKAIIEELSRKFKGFYTEIFNRYHISIEQTHSGNDPMFENKVERYQAREKLKKLNDVIKEMCEDMLKVKKAFSDIEEIQTNFIYLPRGSIQIIGQNITRVIKRLEDISERRFHIYNKSITHIDNNYIDIDLIKVDKNARMAARQELTEPIKWLQQTLNYVYQQRDKSIARMRGDEGVYDVQELNQVTQSGLDPWRGDRVPIVEDLSEIQMEEISIHKYDDTSHRHGFQRVQELAEIFNRTLDNITRDQYIYKAIEELSKPKRNKLKSHIAEMLQLASGSYQEVLKNPKDSILCRGAIDELRNLCGAIDKIYTDLRKVRKIWRYLDEIEVNIDRRPELKQFFAQHINEIRGSIKRPYERFLDGYDIDPEHLIFDETDGISEDILTVGTRRDAAREQLDETIAQLRSIRNKTRNLRLRSILSMDDEARDRRSIQSLSDQATLLNNDSRRLTFSMLLSDGNTSRTYDNLVPHDIEKMRKSISMTQEIRSLEQWLSFYTRNRTIRASSEFSKLRKLFLHAQDIRARIDQNIRSNQWDNLDSAVEEYDKAHFDIQKATIHFFIAEHNHLVQRELVRQLQSYTEGAYNSITDTSQQEAYPFYEAATRFYKAEHDKQEQYEAPQQLQPYTDTSQQEAYPFYEAGMRFLIAEQNKQEQHELAQQLQPYTEDAYNSITAQQEAYPFYREAYHAIVESIKAYTSQNEAESLKAYQDALEQIGKLYRRANIRLGRTTK